METDFRLYQVAKLYYLERMKQNSIAELLGISNIQVSRLLKRAEKEGVVTFRVEAPNSINWTLGAKLKEKFPQLKEAIVVAAGDAGNARDLVGNAAAKYVHSLLADNSIMGISWGRTILAFVKALDVCNCEDVKVFQMSGGFLLPENTDLMPSNMVKMAGNRLKAESYIWNAPLFVASREVRSSLMLDPSLQYVEELGQRMDVAVFGISGLREESTMRSTGVITPRDAKELESLGAVGDVMGHFIDHRGRGVAWSKAERCMGTQLSTVANTKHAICLATGSAKEPVLRLAIEHRYCNTVIISSDLASSLMNETLEGN